MPWAVFVSLPPQLTVFHVEQIMMCSVTVSQTSGTRDPLQSLNNFAFPSQIMQPLVAYRGNM